MAENPGNIEDKLILRENDVLAVVNPGIASTLHDGIRLLTTSKPALSGPDVKARPYEGKYMVVDSPEHESLIPVSTDDAGNPTAKYPNTLASEMMYGFFGEIGYVDLIQQRGTPRLIGIVHVPRKLVYFIGALQGDSGLEDFYKTFCKETEGSRWAGYIWDLKAHPTQFDESALGSLPIDKEQYYWKIEKSERDIFTDRKPLTAQITDYVSAIREFMTKVDNYVYGLMPGLPTGSMITSDIAKARFMAIRDGNVRLLTS